MSDPPWGPGRGPWGPPAPPPPRLGRLETWAWVVVASSAVIILLVAGIGAAVGGRMLAPDEASAPYPYPYADPSAFADVPTEPRYANGRFVALTLDRVVGFDATLGTHEPAWEAPVCVGVSWASPFAPAPADHVVVQCAGEYIDIDVRDGSVRWRYRTRASVDRTRVTPQALLLNSDSGESGFEYVDAVTGTRVWRRTDLGATNGAANTLGAYVASDQGIDGLDPLTGAMRWRMPFPSSGLFAIDTSVFARTNGDHRVLRFDGSSAVPVWVSAGEPTRMDWSDIIGVTDHAVAVYTLERATFLTVFDRATGTKAWQHDGPFAATPTPGGDVIAIVDLDGTIVVLDDRTGAEVRRYQGSPVGGVAAGAGLVAFGAPDGSRELQVVAAR